MIQEDKSLLLEDLCASIDEQVHVNCVVYVKTKKNIKPYLSPLSEMTKEEYDRLKSFGNKDMIDELRLALEVPKGMYN